jgi:hypothetical protein
MRVGLLAVVAVLCLAGRAEAQLCTGSTTTCTATTGSQVDVQTAINTASDGDTVFIPSGAWTWSRANGGSALCSLTNPVAACGQVRIQGKGITLCGIVDGQVQITTLSPGSNDTNVVLDVTEDATHHVSICDLTIRETNNDWFFMNARSVANGKPIRIYGNQTAGANSARFVRFFMARGIVYNNTIAATVTVYNNRQFVSCKSGPTWETAPNYGTADPNGNLNLYVEDNTITNVSEMVDIDDNCRAVVRYNTLTHGFIGSHGADTSTIGARHLEVYNNKWVSFANGNPDMMLNVRGGAWVITDNTFADLPGKPEIKFRIDTLQHANNALTSNHCFGKGISGSQYPVPHQIGQGHNGTSYQTEGVYIWNNGGFAATVQAVDFGGNACNTHCDTAHVDANCNAGGSVDTVATYFQLNRDYFLSAKPGYTKCVEPVDLTCTYPHQLRHDSEDVPPPPVDVIAPVVTVTSPAPFSDSTATTTTATGTCTDAIGCNASGSATNSLNSDTAVVTVASGALSMAAIDLTLGINPITVSIADAATNAGSDIFSVFRDDCGTALPYTNAFALYADATDWSTLGPCFEHYGQGARYTIVGNKAVSTQGGVFDCEVYTGQVLPTDQYVSVTVGQIGAGQQVRLAVRVSGQAGSNNNLYALIYNVSPSFLWLGKYDGPNGLSIYPTAVWDGQYTPVASTSTARLEVEGVTARAYLDVDGAGGGAEVLLGAVNVSDFQNANGNAGTCLIGANTSFDDLEIGLVEPEPADTTAPTITVVAPEHGSTTEAEELEIGELNGTAADETELDRCEFENDRTPGVVALTLLGGMWENAAAIALSTGINVITIRCYDASENVTTEIVSITRQLPDIDPQPPSGKKRFRF